MPDTEGEYAGGRRVLKGTVVHTWSDGEHYGFRLTDLQKLRKTLLDHPANSL